MTTVVECDGRGVDALVDGVGLLPEVIWFQIVDEWGPVPAAPVLEPFDGEVWLDLWDAHPPEPPIDMLVHELAMRAADHHGVDLPEFMARQRWLAQLELDLIKERQAQDDHQGADDSGAAGDTAGVVSAAALGGGGDVPGEREDGDQVEHIGEAEGNPDAGRPQKVPRRRGKGKTGQG